MTKTEKEGREDEHNTTEKRRMMMTQIEDGEEKIFEKRILLRREKGKRQVHCGPHALGSAQKSISLVRRAIKVWKSAMAGIHGNLS